MHSNQFQRITVPAPLRGPDTNTPLEQSSAQPGQQTPPERMTGLCMNCDNRFTCAFPVPEGGVWHCEEYR